MLCLGSMRDSHPLKQHGVFMTNRLFDALEQRFDDIEEVKDVARHGCSGGVNGIIYT